MFRARVCVAVMATSMWLAAPSYAQATYGVRGGLAADPDQFVIGGHLETAGLTQNARLRLRPSIEIGIGDELTSVAGNLDVVYKIELPSPAWALYFGAGPSFNIIHSDFADNDIHGGANAIVGFQHSTGLFLELRAGGGAGPSGMKAMAGYVFKRE